MSRTFHHSKKNARSFKGKMCRCCGAALPRFTNKLFCHNACKQKAYRDRSRERFVKMAQQLAAMAATVKTTRPAGTTPARSAGYSRSERKRS